MTDNNQNDVVRSDKIPLTLLNANKFLVFVKDITYRYLKDVEIKADYHHQYIQGVHYTEREPSEGPSLNEIFYNGCTLIYKDKCYIKLEKDFNLTVQGDFTSKQLHPSPFRPRMLISDKCNRMNMGYSVYTRISPVFVKSIVKATSTMGKSVKVNFGMVVGMSRLLDNRSGFFTLGVATEFVPGIKYESVHKRIILPVTYFMEDCVHRQKDWYNYTIEVASSPEGDNLWLLR